LIRPSPSLYKLKGDGSEQTETDDPKKREQGFAQRRRALSSGADGVPL
jgi:hypothetical protein